MLLPQYTSLVQNQLANFAAQDNFDLVITTAFGNNFDLLQLADLQQQWLAGDFSVIPPIQVLTEGELLGANGAYAAELDRIFISSDFLATASEASITSVLLEEVGHRIDRLLNGNTDSAGDEGEIFSALTRGIDLSPETLAALQAQNDHAVITMGGRSIAVEEAAPIYIDGTFNDDTLDNNLSATSYYITGFNGNDLIDLNPTAANSTLDGGPGNDSLYGGTNDDKIYGGDGNDKIYGGTGNDSLSGGTGDDLLFGQLGNDTLYGDAGNDTLYGGTSGNKFLYGGSGNDIIAANGYATFAEGGEGNDTVDGGDSNDQLYGENDNDVLSGGGGNDTIDGGNGDDELFGDAGNDFLSGGGGNNTLNGGNGDDRLFGGLDHDTLYGGAGDDVLFADIYSSNGILLYGGAGDDYLSGSVNNDTMDGGLGDDTLQGRTGNDILDGQEGDDRINGGDGDDTILGGVGNDTLIGEEYNNDTINSGNDSIVGGDGSDNLSGSSGNDSLFGDAGDDLLNGDGGNDYLYGGSGTNQLFGGNGNDYLQGGVDRDFLYGGGGNDLIEGGDGADLIEGDAGNDTMRGGSGNDIYRILEGFSGATEISDESGADSISIRVLGASALPQLVSLDINTDFQKSGTSLLVDLNGDKLFDPSNDLTIKNFFGTGTTAGSGLIESINNLTGADILNRFTVTTINGTDSNDFLSGDAGDNIINGGNGNDYLIGRAGNDILNGGAGNDVLDGFGDSVGFDQFAGGAGDDAYGIYNVNTTIIENANEGSDTVWTAVSYTLAANVENMYLVGALTGNGNELNNIIIGYGADDHVIDGLDGNDYLAGGNGKDTLNGGNGNDYLKGYDGVDVLNGGAGNDTLDGGVDTTSVDQFEGGTGDDAYGIYNSNTVIIENSNEGNDTVWTQVNYTLTVNIERMYLVGAITGTGNNEDNTIYGHDSASHTIYGLGGNDIISGGIGSDNIWGGAGDDTFIINSPYEGIDKINDFGDGNDRLLLSAAGFGIAAGFLASAKFTTGTAATTVDQRFIYDNASGDLFFDADGLGGSTQVKMAQLLSKPNLTSNNFFLA
jgi:Ca2+-binding RTX toxin-like protein